MVSSVWPYDYFQERHEIDRQDGNHLIVFLISPFNPKERYEELFSFCKSVCSDVGYRIGAKVECERADTPSTPTIVHQDIWNYIQNGDAIIADVSDRNGNVMLELGVAATIRDKNKVIIIRDQESEGDFLFDLSPARHLIYKRGLSGDTKFRKQLTEALEYSLVPAPYVPQDYSGVKLPIKLSFKEANDCKSMLNPSNAYRRLLDDGLEFGSFYVFRYSWLTLGLDYFRNIRIRADLRFTDTRPIANIGPGWIGIMLRSQHFFANYGHLIYVLSNGDIRHTQPVNEFEKTQDDPLLGSISNFELSNWIDFDLQFDEQSLAGSVGGIPFDIPVSRMPFIYNAGLVRFQTRMARACIRSLAAEIPT